MYHVLAVMVGHGVRWDGRRRTHIFCRCRTYILYHVLAVRVGHGVRWDGKPWALALFARPRQFYEVLLRVCSDLIIYNIYIYIYILIYIYIYIYIHTYSIEVQNTYMRALALLAWRHYLWNISECEFAHARRTHTSVHEHYNTQDIQMCAYMWTTSRQM